MADDTSASSPAGVEKKSPIGKMLSRSGSFFSRAPRSTPAQTPDTSERPRSLSPPNSRSGSIRGQSFDAALIETAFDTLPPLGEYSSLLADEAAGADQLKALLKRTMESIGLLKDKCIEVEENYKTALVKATSEYQQSVNELFSMEQKIQSEDSVEGLELKLRHMKERTVKIDKERRTAVARVEDLERLNQRQEMELKDLREVTGGSMDDIRMWAVDAKLTRALMTELGTQKLRIESLELELNHDKNHFAEMSAVFDSKSKDFKTRMETLEKQHTEMTRELTKAEREVAVNYEEMNSYKTALSRTNDRMRQLLETTVTKMEYDEELQRRKVAEMKVENEMAIRKNLEKQLEDTHHKFVKHIDELQAEVETSSITIKEANWKKEAFEKKYNSQTAELNRLSESEKALLLRVQTLEEERSTSLSTYIEKIADLEQERALLNNKYEFDTAALCGSIKHVEMLVERQQSEIVSLHNTIDELKGNIRVFARIRPLLSDETALGQTEPAVVPLSGGYSLRIGKTGRNPAMLDTFMPDDPECTRTFSYDKVFPPTISQSEVFEQVIEYVKATMEGHATCLMSYGQTGITLLS